MLYTMSGYGINMYLLFIHVGKLMYSVGIDEAHEMCINRDGKSSFVRPTKDNFGRLVQFFPYRTTAIKNLKEQLQLNPHAPQLKVKVHRVLQLVLGVCGN